jgi:hypothetical protein
MTKGFKRAGSHGYCMFGKARCKICGDEVRLTLKHFSDKHRDIYDAEVAGKLKMSDFMRRYFD